MRFSSWTVTFRDLSELPNINVWLCANKLTLKVNKTKYLIFQPHQKVNYSLLNSLYTLAGQCLEQALRCRYFK